MTPDEVDVRAAEAGYFRDVILALCPGERVSIAIAPLVSDLLGREVAESSIWNLRGRFYSALWTSIDILYDPGST